MAGIRVLNSVGATVTIDGVERESVTVDAGTTVHWKVAKEGYVPQEGDYTVKENTVFPVVLKRETYEITFVVTPGGSTLTVGLADDSGLHEQEYHTVEDGEEVNIVAKWGDEISWLCSKSGYVPQSDNFTATGDKTVNVTLEEEVVEDPDRTIVFEVSPQEAKLTVNGEEMRDRGTYPLTAKDGDVLEWSCECDGYIQQSGTHTVDGDAEITITLEAYYIYFDPDYLIWDSYEHTDDSAYVYTNMDFTVESDSEWLSCYKDGKDVDLWCSDNFGSERTGTVTATGVEWPLTAKLTITQAAVVNPDRTITFIVSPDNATLTVNGTNVTLSGGTYTMTAKDGDVISWSCEKDGYVSQSGSHTVNGDATITITLEAEATHYITVEPSILTFTGIGRSAVTVSSDGAWTAESGVDWLTLGTYSGEAGETSVTVAASVTDSSRMGLVTFTSEHGKTAYLNVSQFPASGGGTGGDDPDPEEDPDTITASRTSVASGDEFTLTLTGTTKTLDATLTNMSATVGTVHLTLDGGTYELDTQTTSIPVNANSAYRCVLETNLNSASVLFAHGDASVTLIVTGGASSSGSDAEAYSDDGEENG